MNVVAVIGNLVRDPEITYLPDGTALASMRVAVRAAGGKVDGEYVAGFFDVTAFGRQAEICEQYLAKGRQAGFEGSLQFDEWEAKDGTGKRNKVKIRANRVSLIGSRDDGPGEEDGGQTTIDNKPPADDDIPF